MGIKRNKNVAAITQADWIVLRLMRLHCGATTSGSEHPDCVKAGAYLMNKYTMPVFADAIELLLAEESATDRVLP